MQHRLVARVSRSPGFASTGLAVGPIGEDPAILSGTARVQAGGTQLEAATGFPAVNDLKRVEDDGGQPEKGADTTAEQVTVNPVEIGNIRSLENTGCFGSQLDDNRGGRL